MAEDDVSIRLGAQVEGKGPAAMTQPWQREPQFTK